MKLKNWFDSQSADWARFDEYIIIKSGGKKYVTPGMSAKPAAYDPIAVADEIIVDALNIGIMCINDNSKETVIEEAILSFCGKYGLLGFMPALPTTPDFWEDDAVHIPKNPMLRPAKMLVKDYVEMFFPPEKEEMANQCCRSVVIDL